MNLSRLKYKRKILWEGVQEQKSGNRSDRVLEKFLGIWKNYRNVKSLLEHLGENVQDSHMLTLLKIANLDKEEGKILTLQQSNRKQILSKMGKRERNNISKLSRNTDVINYNKFKVVTCAEQCKLGGRRTVWNR